MNKISMHVYISTALLTTCSIVLCVPQGLSVRMRPLDTIEANLYRPIYKFDKAASNFCYPDYATSSNNRRCVTTLNPQSPVYVQQRTCGEYKVFSYYLWYGEQRSCMARFDFGHGNDWERVSVYVQDGEVKRVVYYQHRGHYTRGRGKFERVGERPVVYIGKIAHGSYHHGCDGRCSAKEFFTRGCLGTVEYCQGGCGYWDDFRNPGLTLSDVQINNLQSGRTIDGIKRPDRPVCVRHFCRGISLRGLTTSGCWQNSH